MKRALLVVLAVLILAACGGGGDEPEAADTPAASTPPPTETTEPAVDVAAIEETLTTEAGGDVTNLCPDTLDSWSCFYDGLSARAGGSVQLDLTTDGGRDDAELDAIAEKGGTAVFGLVGLQHEDLEQIVVFVNGQDRATVNRADVPILAMG